MRRASVLVLLAACQSPDDDGKDATGPTGDDDVPTEVPTTEETDPPVVDTATEPTGSTPTTEVCVPAGPNTRSAIVVDIDETMTTSDSEWLLQIVNPSHDPEMRPDANTMMNRYLQLGYKPFYVTARGQGLRLLDLTTAREATEAWLADHGFPFESEHVYLADGIGALGGEAADYKIAVLEDLQAEGYVFEVAYGNADTDIEAFLAVSIPSNRVFLVGDLAGQLGVNPLTNAEAYTSHLPFVDGLPCGY